MRLPHHLLESRFFLFERLPDLIKAVDGSISNAERAEVERLDSLGLPPITSRLTLAAMLGVSPGLIWSLERRPSRHYRTFFIPKGRTQRRIDAPRVALKIVQKWISVQLDKVFSPASHVYGFVKNRSHIEAAVQHCEAEWVFSVDIRDFFPSTQVPIVEAGLREVGFGAHSAELIARLCCLGGALAQGAPSSPVLSNICFNAADKRLAEISSRYPVVLTRYADDVVFSGKGNFPDEIRKEVELLFEELSWTLAEEKTRLAVLPNRLKVHGLLVHGADIRLTKGYRNKIRAFKYLLEAGKIKAEDLAIIKGHINYAEQVNKVPGKN